jgi:hypothetical protein
MTTARSSATEAVISGKKMTLEAPNPSCVIHLEFSAQDIE